MIRAQEHTDQQPQPAQTGRADRHPAWCDRTRCTADAAGQANGYRSDVRGEHRSALIRLNLTTALLPVRDGTAWLTEACVPWPCDAFLRVQIGDVELSMSADYATPLLDALLPLLTSAATPEEVTR
jgi:hypothetical protein